MPKSPRRDLEKQRLAERLREIRVRTLAPFKPSLGRRHV